MDFGVVVVGFFYVDFFYIVGIGQVDVVDGFGQCWLVCFECDLLVVFVQVVIEFEECIELVQVIGQQGEQDIVDYFDYWFLLCIEFYGYVVILDLYDGVVCDVQGVGEGLQCLLQDVLVFEYVEVVLGLQWFFDVGQLFGLVEVFVYYGWFGQGGLDLLYWGGGLGGGQYGQLGQRDEEGFCVYGEGGVSLSLCYSIGGDMKYILWLFICIVIWMVEVWVRCVLLVVLLMR